MARILGFSVGRDGLLRAQNRGQYLTRPLTGQFARLNDWLAMHEEDLFDVLGESLILFGEWAAAVHSLEYPDLPDYRLSLCTTAVKRNSGVRPGAMRWSRSWGCVAFTRSGEEDNLPSIEQPLRSSTSAYRHGACEGVYLSDGKTTILPIARAACSPGFRAA